MGSPELLGDMPLAQSFDEDLVSDNMDHVHPQHPFLR
jgi:hypothetical protein